MKLTLTFTVLLASAILLVSGDGEETKPPNDCVILGSYILESDSKAADLDEFLKAMEYSDEDREKVRNASSGLNYVRIKKGWAKDEYSYAISYSVYIIMDTFKLGKEYESHLIDGRKYKATVTMSDNTVKKVEKHEAGFEAIHKFVFSEEGYEVERTAKDKTAKQKYKRKEKDDCKGGNNFFGSMKEGFSGLFG